MSAQGTRTVATSEETLTFLRQIPYFARLDDEALKAVARAIVQRNYEPGEVIFLEGMPCAGLFLVQEGQVKLVKTSADGREQTLHFVQPGQSFNDVSVWDGEGNPVTAVAITPVTCWVIDRESMLRLVEQYPVLAISVIESIARRTRHLVQLVEDLSFRPVQARLAKLLLDEAKAHGHQDHMPRLMTQQEMAARLGTVREVVGRALRNLEHEGIIRIERHRIIIVDRKRLEEQAML